MTRQEKRTRLIHALAVFLCENAAGKSIELQMESQRPKPAPLTNWAEEWANLAAASNLNGWRTVEEAEKILEEIL